MALRLLGQGALLGRRRTCKGKRKVSKLLSEKKWMGTNSMQPGEVTRNVVQGRLVVGERGREPIAAWGSPPEELAALGEAGL